MVSTRILSHVMTATNVLLHLVVHVAPSWTVYRQYTSPNLVGLWVICSKDYGCHRPQMDEVNMNVVRGFMATAFLSSFMALIWSVEWDHVIHCNFTFISKALASSIFSFLAGTCVLVALLVFLFTVILEIEEVPHIKKWAFYLSIVICILSFLAGVVDLLAYKYMLWGMGPSQIDVAPETAEEIERQNSLVPRLL